LEVGDVVDGDGIQCVTTIRNERPILEEVLRSVGRGSAACYNQSADMLA
jgi:hypothetical protein